VANCVAPAATADDEGFDASVSVMSAEAGETALGGGWRVMMANAANCEATAVNSTVVDEGAGALAVSPLSMGVVVVSDLLVTEVSHCLVVELLLRSSCCSVGGSHSYHPGSCERECRSGVCSARV
jgi:hypothetical protein